MRKSCDGGVKEVEEEKNGENSGIPTVWTQNVAWYWKVPNIGICSKCLQEPTFKVSSKSGQ